uniref:BMERB domain-containing protein n=1 Tax=Calidris pygmaea TaxID=425635 RepID=A0A8C3JHA3_9CHAR
MSFPLLSSKKPGLHWKDSSASCQSAPGEDHSQTQLASYRKPPEGTRGHFKPCSPVFQIKEKAREMPEDICLYVPHCPVQNRTRGSPGTPPGNGTLAADYSGPEDIDGDIGTYTAPGWKVKNQKHTSKAEDFNRETKVVSCLDLKEKDDKHTRHRQEKFEQELKEAKKRMLLCTQQQPLSYDSNGADLGGTNQGYRNKGAMRTSEEKDADWKEDGFKLSGGPVPLLFADDTQPAFPGDTKDALRNPDAAAREHTAGQPKSPLRLIANAIKRSILEPLTSSPEGLKQDSDSKVKASSEQSFFIFPSTPDSLSQRNSNNNRINNTQAQELKVREWSGEYLETGSPLSNPCHFSVSSQKRSPRDYSEKVSFPVYSPHTRPSKTTSIPQKSSCTRMEDVPGLLEKFTFKETPSGAPVDDIFICNEKYLLLSSPEPKNTSKDNSDDSAQKGSLGSLFDRLRSKVYDREGNYFVSSLSSMTDRSPEDRLRYPSTGCEHPPVIKQATEYSTSSSDDEFEPQPSLTHKAKRTLRRRRKLEKETKQLIKQEELKRLHKAQAIQRQLEELEERQRALEIFGVKLERELRGESDSGTKDETQMLHEWFELVLEKNKLMRYESELLIIAQELELEDHQSRLEQKLREKMAIDNSLKDEMDLNEEDEIFAEMMKVVEERDKLVSTLEEQRVKEKAEDQHFESIMLSRGYQLSRI